MWKKSYKVANSKYQKYKSCKVTQVLSKVNIFRECRILTPSVFLVSALWRPCRYGHHNKVCVTL